MFRQVIRKFLFLRSFDTRGRNTDVASALESLLNNDSTILDAGCGENGIANFVSKGKFAGVDLHPPNFRRKGVAFIQASMLSLPFRQDSFSLVTSVDVLEHLSPEARRLAIAEMVRVAKKGILVAFPYGQSARKIDEKFYERLKSTDQQIPEWLAEHLQFEYPEIDSVRQVMQSEAGKRGLGITIRVSYSENVKLTSLLRCAAAKSTILYVIGNFLIGLLQPLFPKVRQGVSYRAILIGEFGN